MNKIAFYLTYPILWLFSILPMRILYFISNFLFFLVYYVFGYRKKVILENIKQAFPNKSDKEQEQIAKKFYLHFTDMVVESVKAFTISKKTIQKRYSYKNPDLVNKFVAEGRSIVLISSHLANWEWSTSLPLVIDTTIFGAYNSLRNKTFEDKLKETRQKFGVVGAKTSDFMSLIKTNFDKKIQGAYILLSDQSPHVDKSFYWSDFFGVFVPIHTGAEMLAKKHNMVVINYRAKKVKRGYYEVDFELITDQPTTFKDYDITEQFLRITERNVQEQPEYYLWSHKRFKHKDKYEEWIKIDAARKQTKN